MKRLALLAATGLVSMLPNIASARAHFFFGFGFPVPVLAPILPPPPVAVFVPPPVVAADPVIVADPECVPAPEVVYAPPPAEFYFSRSYARGFPYRHEFVRYHHWR